MIVLLACIYFSMISINVAFVLKCSSIDGKCTCKPGYRGRLCNALCQPGTYGDGCKKVGLDSVKCRNAHRRTSAHTLGVYITSCFCFSAIALLMLQAVTCLQGSVLVQLNTVLFVISCVLLVGGDLAVSTSARVTMEREMIC